MAGFGPPYSGAGPVPAIAGLSSLSRKLARMDEMMGEMTELYKSIYEELRERDPSLSHSSTSESTLSSTGHSQRGTAPTSRRVTHKPPPPKRIVRSQSTARDQRASHRRADSAFSSSGGDGSRKMDFTLKKLTQSTLPPDADYSMGVLASPRAAKPKTAGTSRFKSADCAGSDLASMKRSISLQPSLTSKASGVALKKKHRSFTPQPPPGPPPAEDMPFAASFDDSYKRPRDMAPLMSAPPMTSPTAGALPLGPVIKKRKKRTGLPDDGLSEKHFFKKYWIEAGKVGEGAFSRVRKITRKADKAQFALKVVKKKGKAKEDIVALQKEIYVLQKVDHPNIVKLLDWCDTKKRIYMVVEFCDGGDVFERIVSDKKFSEKDAARVIKQVASALGSLHMHKFVHRDLKPDNLMYVTKALDAQIKVIDLGLAGDFNLGPCTTPCGTAHYAAPEVLAGAPYDSQADMWSLGVICYTLLCGFPPFFDTNNDMKNLYHMIKKARFGFPSPFWDDISGLAKDFIRKCLTKESRDRLTASQALVHGWVTGAPEISRTFSSEYIEQMSKWQHERRETEMAIGGMGLAAAASAVADEQAVSRAQTARAYEPAPYKPKPYRPGTAL